MVTRIRIPENIRSFLIEIGDLSYFAARFFRELFTRPFEFKELMRQCYNMGNRCLLLVGVKGFILGLVFTLQSRPTLMEFGAESWMPSMVSISIVREIGPVITALICAGRIASGIGAELGSMRVTEQIDALEVMGINSLNYLVFPKTIALMLYPFAIAIGMFLGVLGGMAACIYGGYTTLEDYVLGIQTDFDSFHMTYSFIKTFVFAFILATIPSFHGYYMKGGALEVGKASTVAFVWTSVVIILLNYILTDMLLG